MSPLLRRVGTRGAAVLAATGLAGGLLAAHGWADWRTPVVPGGLGPGAAAGRLSGSASGPAAAASPRNSPGRTAGPASSPSPASSARHPGPLLASQPFAPYAYQIWPGRRSSAAQAALAGLTITTHRQSTGLSVVAGVNGQPGSPRFYPAGARVYVVEAALGDDSGNSDYNLGDDGIVVTDAQGRIVS